MKIVLLRHGVALEDGRLLPEGLEQAKRMGERLAALQIGPAMVFCSHSDRAVTCAGIISGPLKTTHAIHDLALSWGGGCAPVACMSLLRESRDFIRLAVIVTHRPEIVGAFEYFTNSEHYRLIGEGPRLIEPMQGYLVDLEEKTIQFIAHDEQ